MAESFCHTSIKERPRAEIKIVSGSKLPYNPVSAIDYNEKEHIPDMLHRFIKKACKYNGCVTSTKIICKNCNYNLCLTPIQ